MNKTFQKFSMLTTSLQVLLIISIIACLFAVIADLMQLQLLDAINTEYSVSVDRQEANDKLIALSGYIQLVVLAVSGIVFLMWIYRAYNNLRTIGARGMEFTPGWAVGWFFIPIANFWKPYQVLKELCQKSSVEWLEMGTRQRLHCFLEYGEQYGYSRYFWGDSLLPLCARLKVSMPCTMLRQ